jgi:hypothetical protein
MREVKFFGMDEVRLARTASRHASEIAGQIFMPLAYNYVIQFTTIFVAGK